MYNKHWFCLSVIKKVAMKFCKNLKTSQKIITLFSVFNFVSLIILLFSINVIYFFIWYTDQKEESWYDMNINYQSIVWSEKSNREAFKKYILQKDTIIIPNKGEKLVCSPWVAKKLHNNMELLEEVKNSLFYKNDGKIYLIFTNEYKDIWVVKVLFDTTPYIKSQIIIIKTSLILIVLFMLLYILWGKIISSYALRNLRKISDFARDIDLDTRLKKIKIHGPKDDEIKIVAQALNKSFSKIKKQSKSQKQFITDVSHEFKTPLMIINSKIDVYNKKNEKGLCQANDLQLLLSWIKGNTKKLNTLLETLFLLSRFGDGIIDFKREEVLLSQLVEYTAQELIKNGNKKIILNTKISRNIVKNIEISTFTILLENLLTNAIKFSSDESIIEVWLTQEKLWVKDYGVWIDKKEINNIFEKFYRKDESVEWFGVWLFIVKRILKLYNWQIEVKSKKNKGSTFIIKF